MRRKNGPGPPTGNPDRSTAGWLSDLTRGRLDRFPCPDRLDRGKQAKVAHAVGGQVDLVVTGAWPGLGAAEAAVGLVHPVDRSAGQSVLARGAVTAAGACVSLHFFDPLVGMAQG